VKDCAQSAKKTLQGDTRPHTWVLIGFILWWWQLSMYLCIYLSMKSVWQQSIIVF